MYNIRKFYKNTDFKKGDFIVYEYEEGEYLKGLILELKKDKALIEVALPCKKNTKLQIEKFEVEYDEIIPFSDIFIEFASKKNK